MKKSNQISHYKGIVNIGTHQGKTSGAYAEDKPSGINHAQVLQDEVASTPRFNCGAHDKKVRR